MKRKQIVIFVMILLAVACFSSLFTAAVVSNDVNKRINQAVSAEKAHYEKLLIGLDSFIEVKGKVDENFVEDVDYEKLEEDLIKYYISLLGDKYTMYHTKEELKGYMQNLSGSYVGIGVYGGKKDGKMYVKSVVENSPAYEANILAGEYIVAIDGVEITEENYEEVAESISGEKGTTVSLKVQSFDGTFREILVERKDVLEKSVTGEIIDGDIGYVKISRFTSMTDEEFIKTVDEMISKGVKGFLFDVRNNSGGELGSVVKVLDRLLPEGPIVNIVDGSGKVETRMSTSNKSVDLPMAVLVNKNTASAAELFASALRDYELAELYGVTTYGKGYVQRIITLSDGSGLRISFAKYNPPYGENYDKVGVAPHVYVDDDKSTSEDEQLELAKKYFINKSNN